MAARRVPAITCSVRACARSVSVGLRLCVSKCVCVCVCVHVCVCVSLRDEHALTNTNPPKHASRVTRVEQLHARGVFWRIRGGPPGGAAGSAGAPAAVVLRDSRKRGTDNPHDLIFWRIRKHMWVWVYTFRHVAWTNQRTRETTQLSHQARRTQASAPDHMPVLCMPARAVPATT